MRYGFDRIFIGTALTAFLMAGSAQAAPVYWVDWQRGFTQDDQTYVLGQVTVGADVVDVTFSTATDAIAFVQYGDAADTDFWANLGGLRDDTVSPYTSTGPGGVDNAPTGTDMVALERARTYSLTFSRAVTDLTFAFLSLNGGNYLTFSTPLALLSSGNADIDGNGTDACGSTGCGTLSVSVEGLIAYQVTADEEGSGAVRAPGSFTSIQWDGAVDEFWNGFTVGVSAVGDDPVSPVPLPAGGLLLVGGLAALAAYRKRR